MSMTTQDIDEKIKRKILELARGMKYQKALIIIDKYLKKNKKTDWILLKKAFIQYHYAAALMYGDLNHPNKKNIISNNFKSAINICNKIINNNDTNNSTILNARLYLAQIYVMIKQYKKAEKIALQTYRQIPSSLTAERLADIYNRSNNINKAILWYKKAVKKTKNKTEKLIAQISLAVCYKQNNKKQAFKEAKIAKKFFIKSIKDENAILLGKSLYVNFPELKK